MTRTYRYVRIHLAMDCLQLGWLPHATLEGTPHESYSVHMEWRCCCGREPPFPTEQQPERKDKL